MKNTLPAGIPQQPLSEEAEAALVQKIITKHREEDITELAMNSLCEAIPYLCTVSKGRVEPDELMSLSYQGLLHAARNYKPGRIRFFCYAKIYLRSVLNKWWKAQDLVKNSSRVEDKEMSTSRVLRQRESVAPPFEEIDLKERWELVKPLLNRLTERERMILELVYIGGYNYTEVAKMLVPPVTREAVRVCHLHAMERIRLAILKLKRTLVA